VQDVEHPQLQWELDVQHLSEPSTLGLLVTFKKFFFIVNSVLKGHSGFILSW